MAIYCLYHIVVLFLIWVQSRFFISSEIRVFQNNQTYHLILSDFGNQCLDASYFVPGSKFVVILSLGCPNLKKLILVVVSFFFELSGLKETLVALGNSPTFVFLYLYHFQIYTFFHLLEISTSSNF